METKTTADATGETVARENAAQFAKDLETFSSERQARAQFESIAALVRTENQNDMRESVEREIQESPLSVLVRGGWHVPGDGADVGGPEEFEILLCTGGPAVRIRGELTEHGEPDTARLEHQDWGTPWTEYRLTCEEDETLLAYCRCFYFGD